ncbi:hypothetical protein LR48_Vigan08g189100 [Vigna angularis]|uniref:Transmembrane protein n=2 Tax=Phaseolus angularis TaxID=3914 RepID=A0A0L9V8T5_PHAAN|nr:uncharacterized protein LOC108340164 [Vigna angularis]KAG2398040.1 uncharacterized protein HKW66_Vig0137240 [Vigna angularis]KOM51064.1 hypothetical protein LR48_Vigan08g189100 [Vigna angularis]BAT91108.1 hypothetical protein VIGAN_06241600 [Vigna angularis var. angularis]
MECVGALNSKGLSPFSSFKLPFSSFKLSIAMAKTKTKGLQYPKPKASFFLCCFGSVQTKTPKDNSTIITRHNPPKQNIRTSKKSMAKTVPLQEGLEFPDMKSNTKLHSSSWKWRSKSKSMSMSKSKPNPLSNTQINSTLRQPLSQSQSPKRGNKPEYDTRQHAVSLPSSKRQHVVHETTGRDWKQKQKHQQDHVIGACMFIISLISMIVLGRLGSIFCTTSFVYLIPSFAKRQRQFRR